MVPRLVCLPIPLPLSTKHYKLVTKTNLSPRIPFYAWFRAIFLLWLIAPQTQGARLLYENQIHPFLRENEVSIDDFISSAHERLKTAGLQYLKQLVEIAKEHALGIPPKRQQAQAAAAASPSTLSYAQTLLNRFNLPSAKPAFAAASSTTTDVYSLLANAVQAYAAGSPSTTRPNLVPPNIRGPERASFISQQRERLTFLLSVLDREAAQSATQPEAGDETPTRAGMFYDGPTMSGEETSQVEDLPKRASAASSIGTATGLIKSMSVGDFEKIDETDEGIIQAGQEGSNLQQQRPKVERGSSGTGSGWMPWQWGAKNPSEKVEKKVESEKGADQGGDAKGKSSAVDV